MSSSNDKALKELSDTFVNRIFDKYIYDNNDQGFGILLFGKAHYKVEAFPGAGQNFRVILNSIYDYYKNNPNKGLDKILDIALSCAIKDVYNPKDFNLLMNYIDQELDNEKTEKSPFSVNVVKLLEELKAQIESYEPLKTNPLFTDDLQRTNKYFEDKHGHKI